MAKSSIKRRVVDVPKSINEAAEFLSAIGKEQRAIDKIQSNLNQRIDELKTAVIARVAEMPLYQIC